LITGTFVSSTLSISSSVGPGALSLTGQVAQNDDSFLGTYQSSINSNVVLCADHGTLTATKVPSLAGQWVGSGSSHTTGNSVQISLNLSEQGTDAFGFPMLTGTANVQGLSCQNGTGIFSGDQRGLAIAGPGGNATAMIGNEIVLSTQTIAGTGTLPPSDTS